MNLTDSRTDLEDHRNNKILFRDKKESKQLILFTSSNFPTGGPSATYLDLFCRGIKENDGDIRVYLFRGHLFKDYKNHNQTSYNISYTYLGFTNRSKNKILKIFEDIISILKTIKIFFKLIPLRKKTQIFVYSNVFSNNLPVYIFAKLLSINVISFVPEYYDYSEINKFNLLKRIKFISFIANFKTLNTLSAKLIVFSHFLKDYYLKKGFYAKNIIIQPNLTDLSAWYIPNQATNYTIGYAGTPSKKDGIFDLISSIAILKEKGKLVNAVIIGDSLGKETYLPNLKAHCDKLGLSEQVTFKGLLPQHLVKKYLNSCQILSITRPDTIQTKAGFPTKLGEYMACKKIVLATNFGDIDKYFTHKENIILAEPGNPNSIAESILWILDNPEKAKIIANNGYQKAQEIFDYKEGVRKILCSLNI
jgi:glycosyltransferase involved in cell wall biosynthesis